MRQKIQPFAFLSFLALEIPKGRRLRLVAQHTRLIIEQVSCANCELGVIYARLRRPDNDVDMLCDSDVESVPPGFADRSAAVVVLKGDVQQYLVDNVGEGASVYLCCLEAGKADSADDGKVGIEVS